MTKAPGKYTYTYDEIKNRVVEHYSPENLNPEIKNYGIKDFFTSYARTVPGNIMLSDAQAQGTLGVGKGAIDIAQTAEEIVGEVTETPTNFIQAIDMMYNDDTGFKYIDDYTKDRSVLHKLDELIPDDSLGTAGGFTRFLSNMSVYPGVYSFAKAKGLGKFISTIAALTSENAVFTQKGEDNLVEVLSEGYDLDPKAEDNWTRTFVKKGVEWAKSDQDENFLHQVLKDTTGNSIPLGVLGLGYYGFKTLRHLFKNPNNAKTIRMEMLGEKGDQ